MSLQALRDRLPEYARDIKLNLGSLAAETLLNEKQKAGTFITAEQVQAAVRIAAAINAAAAVLDVETSQQPAVALAASGRCAIELPGITRVCSEEAAESSRLLGQAP